MDLTKNRKKIKALDACESVRKSEKDTVLSQYLECLLKLKNLREALNLLLNQIREAEDSAIGNRLARRYDPQYIEYEYKYIEDLFSKSIEIKGQIEKSNIEKSRLENSLSVADARHKLVSEKLKGEVKRYRNGLISKEDGALA